MTQRNFYTPEKFSKMKPVLKQMLLLHCSIEIVDFFAIVFSTLYMVK